MPEVPVTMMFFVPIPIFIGELYPQPATLKSNPSKSASPLIRQPTPVGRENFARDIGHTSPINPNPLSTHDPIRPPLFIR